MSEFFGKLFGLREVTLSDPGVRLELAREWAPWVWAFLLLAATTFAAWSYWRLIGPVAARASLATLRTLTIAALLVMIAGPQLVKQSERIEKDWVVVLVDRSASMKIADVGDSLGQREDQLRQALIAGVPSWNAIRADRNLLFLGFDAGAYDLKAPDVAATGLTPGTLPVTLNDPEGRRTSLARSIDQALRRVASRPVAGLVVISDGKSDEGLTRPLQRQIEARQVPIFPVPLGSPTPIPDFAVARVEAPPAAPEWRVYKPLGIMPKCLACHGDSAGQSEALKTKLATLYPADKASDYSAGEWRGLIRVTVADAPAK